MCLISVVAAQASALRGIPHVAFTVLKDAMDMRHRQEFLRGKFGHQHLLCRCRQAYQQAEKKTITIFQRHVFLCARCYQTQKQHFYSIQQAKRKFLSACKSILVCSATRSVRFSHHQFIPR